MSVYKTSRPKRRTVPDWTAVQCAEDAGTPLIDQWRDYASTAAQPYGVSHFRLDQDKLLRGC